MSSDQLPVVYSSVLTPGNSPPSDWKLERWDDFSRWCVTFVWKQNTPDHPHLTCFLINLDPLRDDRLSTAEMRTILTMSGVRAADKGHENHTRIPVSHARYIPLLYTELF